MCHGPAPCHEPMTPSALRADSRKEREAFNEYVPGAKMPIIHFAGFGTVVVSKNLADSVQLKRDLNWRSPSPFAHRGPV